MPAQSLRAVASHGLCNEHMATESHVRCTETIAFARSGLRGSLAPARLSARSGVCFRPRDALKRDSKTNTAAFKGVCERERTQPHSGPREARAHTQPM